MSSIDSLAAAIGAALDDLRAASTGIGRSGRIARDLRGHFSTLGTDDKAAQAEAVAARLDDQRTLVASAQTHAEDALSMTESLRASGSFRSGPSSVPVGPSATPVAPGPDFARAEFDRRKLTSYALDPSHPVGGAKARVIRSGTGLGRDDAEEVRRQILEKAPRGEAIPGRVDEHGSRWSVDVPLAGPDGSMKVRSGWITDRTGATKLVTVSLPPKGDR